MSTTSIGGTNYTVIGSDSSPVLLKNKGGVKIQWGNKFIDLVKNGKISSEGGVDETSQIKKVETADEITSDGVYLVGETEVWVQAEGSKINVKSGDESFVSYLQDDTAAPREQKVQALKNIGFYYKNLTEAAEVISGIIYVESEQDLYIVSNGVLIPYVPSNANSDTISTGTLTLSSQDVDKITSTKNIRIIANNEEYVELGGNKIAISKDIKANRIYSSEMNNVGYKLYNNSEGKSILEVDTLVWRNIENELKANTTHLSEYELFGDANIILSAENALKLPSTETVSEIESEIVITTEVKCTLKYPHTYVVGDSVYVGNYKSSEKIIFIKCNITQVDTGYIILTYSGYVANISNAFVGQYIYKANSLLTKIQNGTIIVSDNERASTVIGKFKESDFPGLVSSDSNEKTGIYSDGFVGLNSVLYDPIFKKIQSYPKYYDDVVIPENYTDSSHDQVVPNIAWVKSLVNILIPTGSIIMWSGDTVPDGWAICNGENGTPNLIGKFIKADATVGENTTDLDLENKLALTEQVVGTGETSIFTLDKESLVLEPNAYSLIFIMKID